MKLNYSLAIASALAAMGTAHAATISWSNQLYTVNGASGQNLDTGIFQKDGTLILADNTGGSALSFDGIAFAAGSIGFGNSYNGFHDNTTSPLSATGTWSYTRHPETVSLTGLTSGNHYRVQALVYEGRKAYNGRYVKFDGIDQGVFAHGTDNTWGDGLLVTGTFVADAATQNFTIEYFEANGNSAGGQLNALLVHEVPEPSSAALFGGLACLALLRRRRK
jgi:hypothetical protein